MQIKDLKNYVFDYVVVYKKNPNDLSEWDDLYEGELSKAPMEILNLVVKTIGGKKAGVLDIRVK